MASVCLYGVEEHSLFSLSNDPHPLQPCPIPTSSMPGTRSCLGPNHLKTSFERAMSVNLLYKEQSSQTLKSSKRSYCATIGPRDFM